jgi:hypothetical protein
MGHSQNGGVIFLALWLLGCPRNAMLVHDHILKVILMPSDQCDARALGVHCKKSHDFSFAQRARRLRMSVLVLR